MTFGRASEALVDVRATVTVSKALHSSLVANPSVPAGLVYLGVPFKDIVATTAHCAAPPAMRGTLRCPWTRYVPGAVMPCVQLVRPAKDCVMTSVLKAMLLADGDGRLDHVEA